MTSRTRVPTSVSVATSVSLCLRVFGSLCVYTRVYVEVRTGVTPVSFYPRDVRVDYVSTRLNEEGMGVRPLRVWGQREC